MYKGIRQSSGARIAAFYSFLQADIYATKQKKNHVEEVMLSVLYLPDKMLHLHIWIYKLIYKRWLFNSFKENCNLIFIHQ